MSQQALVLAVHGSRHPGAMAALAAFRDRMAARYPDWRVDVARTVGRKHGRSVDFGGARRICDVLAAMVAEGARRVVVQSLHVVPGEEYHEMLADMGHCLERSGRDVAVSVGAPLLADPADMDAVAQGVLDTPVRRMAGEGLVIMGHGAPPPGAGLYALLRERLATRDALAHFGTMPREREAACTDILRIRDALTAAKVATAWLMPFFTVAGAHACTDLAGNTPISWRSILEAAGIRCQPLLAGLIEGATFTDIWHDHLAKAMTRLA